MEAEVKDIIWAFKDAARVKRHGNHPFSIPAEHLFNAIEIALTENMDFNARKCPLDREAWRAAVEFTGFDSLVAYSGLGGVARVLPELDSGRSAHGAA